MSSFELVQTACVIRYPYLWAREASHGETDGRKHRPTAVGVRLNRAGGDLLVLFPITSKAPHSEGLAVEIPDTEKRRAGLDAEMRLWIVFDEFNTDIVGQSFHLEPEPPIGRFSKAFFLPLMRSFIAQRKRARGIDRTA